MAATCLAFAGPAPAQSAGPPTATASAVQSTVYRNATLIDGSGAASRPNVSIVVEGDRIKAVLPSGEAEVAFRTAEVVDANGLYALPGLIDTHVHYATSPNRRMAEGQMRRSLYSGVTAVRDMAGDTRALNELARASLLGEIPGPDVYYAALMAGPTFFQDRRTIASARGAEAGQTPWMQAITDETDMKIAVAMARGTGASAIKIYADLPARLVAGITAEAHRQGLPVWTHFAVFPATPKEVVDAAVDVVSHICMLPNQFSNPLPQSFTDRPPFAYAEFRTENPQVTALFEQMSRQGTILDATLGICAFKEKKGAKTGPQPDGAADLSARLTAQARRMGVAISAGTDLETPWWGQFPYLHDELELLVREAGFSPAEAIVSATSTAARALGRQGDMGTVQVGKLANLMFVSKDPLADVRNLRAVTFTVKRGVVYRRENFKPLAFGEGSGPAEAPAATPTTEAR